MTDSLSQHCPNCEAQAAEIEKLREALQGVTPPAYFGESEQHKAWWAKARAALGETE